MSQRVAIVGAAAVSPYGLQWRGFGEALRRGESFAGEIPESMLKDDGIDPRQRKLMSRGARLAAVAARLAIQDAGWTERREEIGYYLGVGASGGNIDQLTAMLNASMDDGRFEPYRFGTDGLSACNPLMAFQLMNNFTLCHGAIQEGLQGPNAAFFSRGIGTVRALEEAVHAITSGECGRALAGGADSALHPVTMAELRRDGVRDDVAAGEGAGLLALTLRSDKPLGWIEVVDTSEPNWSAQIQCDYHVVAATMRPPVGSRKIDFTGLMGESLAATPALAWSAAVDLLVDRSASTVLVTSTGPDGELGAVVISTEPR